MILHWDYLNKHRLCRERNVLLQTISSLHSHNPNSTSETLSWLWNYPSPQLQHVHMYPTNRGTPAVIEGNIWRRARSVDTHSPDLPGAAIGDQGCQRVCRNIYVDGMSLLSKKIKYSIIVILPYCQTHHFIIFKTFYFYFTFLLQLAFVIKTILFFPYLFLSLPVFLSDIWTFSKNK